MDATSPPNSSRLPDAAPGGALPREKIMHEGRSSLTDEELIALFLRTGMKGCHVLELAALLKKRAGSLAALGRMETADILALCKGIGPAKAATLAAVFELGHRAAREAQRFLCLKSAEAVYERLVDEMRFLNQEHMVVLMLNARHELIRRVDVGQGTLTRVVLHARDVFREAVRQSAHCIILAHNHPSGHPEPSSMDKTLTANIESAGELLGIPLMDHVIIGAPQGDGKPPYFSFREHGLLKSL